MAFRNNKIGHVTKYQYILGPDGPLKEALDAVFLSVQSDLLLDT